VSDPLAGAFQVFFEPPFGALCALVIGLWVVFLIIAIWVYRDAESRGMSGVLWLLVVLVGGIIGLIVYLVVREDKRTPMGVYPYGPGGAVPFPGGAPPAPPPSAGRATCPNCGASLEPGAAFCSKCGARL
jgi:hypothetical protein